MLSAVLLVCLAAFPLFTPVDGRHIHSERLVPVRTSGTSFKRLLDMRPSGNIRRNLLETHINNKGTVNSSSKMHRRDYLSILKSNLFLCQDSRAMVPCNGLNLLFCFIHFMNHHELPSSFWDKVLPNRTRDKMEKREHTLPVNGRRWKRSPPVNPSDPFGSENLPPTKEQTLEQDREPISAVSKETITSCDDPLHVLLFDSPGSPRQSKTPTLKHK
ncbi:uncharacterized protein LOC114766704 [Denticeps clupeoides]|uniref:uncharacterized protein LOC114766704 n=1 Tax=Denticeps clupeoides TaxID=299321 RepID=UPI0010A413C2|nr:uncharacterized protein LOC114766704 [Denticeps clupeoides]